MRKKTCEVRNGIRKPHPGSIREKVWGICASLPQPPSRKRVLEIAHSEGIAPGTASTRFAEYLIYHKD